MSDPRTWVAGVDEAEIVADHRRPGPLRTTRFSATSKGPTGRDLFLGRRLQDP